MRLSDYDVSGARTNWKLAMEWRPVEDLLVRGTATQVFRAPNPDELFDGPTATNPAVIDPCLNQPASYLAAHQGLCQYCLLYTSDAADERSSVDLGGRRIIKKKK